MLGKEPARSGALQLQPNQAAMQADVKKKVCQSPIPHEYHIEDMEFAWKSHAICE